MAEIREERPPLPQVPSFGEMEEEEIAAVHQEPLQQISADRPAEQGDDDSSDDFEFTFAVRNPMGEAYVTADEIFFNGRILPAYPVFDRSLLLSTAGEPSAEVEEAISLRRILAEERRSSQSASSDAVGERCAWLPRSVPQSSECRTKSASTGSSRQWRFRDLVVGRSQSDGKEKFHFLPAPRPPATQDKTPNPNPKTTATKAAVEKKVRATKLDLVTAHRLHYGKGNGEKAKVGQRSLLPYRRGLLGFFANISDLSRKHHPF